MGFLTYVHARTTGGGIHIQATGDAFPQGYASGDIANVSDVVREELNRTAFKPSMRGSAPKYAVLTVVDNAVRTAGGAEVCTLKQLIDCLGNPQPPYSPGDEDTVRERVQTTLSATPPQPCESEGNAVKAPFNKQVFIESLTASLSEAIADALEDAGL